ncbi:prephenate dehydrogenase [Nesterenkonia alkaliphila]|uniref:Prephenate dehydrogenase n=1 Tax=Nesterenkonia alkaliphila TaxID=1463631 RepID=A0A7K1UHM5_9MICC|nr:prephenate dehydrogenase [Nesterenkonia alkaliphila]MVT25973.1 prephenate dehydrogenase [Nesterenkonia alkaliphila]GFZ95611.1 prephenate dehydrogenase [Nesterenkonia alkaliphila]
MVEPAKLAVLIRGTGLLGASIGLGLRKAGHQVQLSDPSPTAQRIAQDIGAGTIWQPEQGTDPDLIIIAAPPEVTAAEVADALLRFPGGVVLDIASVKAAILTDLVNMTADNAAPLTREHLTRYVGTHPMAGREQSGPVAARGELFTSMPWVICPHQDSAAAAVQAAVNLAQTLGASVHRMDAVKHDESVALISHLPQVAASLVASRLQDAEAGALALSGNGLRDVTRIAASDPNLWVQILSANSRPLVEILHGLREDVERLISTLEDPAAPGGQADIAQLIAEGNAGVARVPGKHGAPPQSFSVVTVIVDDRPGQISAVLNDVGKVGVNVEDLRMEHSAGHQVGMLEVSVLPGRRDELAQALTEMGWKVVLH